MENEKWSPDPEVLRHMVELMQNSELKNDCIAVGSRILTWQDVLEEVRQGTRFGRNYYQAFLESSASLGG